MLERPHHAASRPRGARWPLTHSGREGTDEKTLKLGIVVHEELPHMALKTAFHVLFFTASALSVQGSPVNSLCPNETGRELKLGQEHGASGSRSSTPSF